MRQEHHNAKDLDVNVEVITKSNLYYRLLQILNSHTLTAEVQSDDL